VRSWSERTLRRPSPQSRVIAAAGGWPAWSRWAPSWPFELLIAAGAHLPDLPAAAPTHAALAKAPKVGLASLDLLFDAPMLYMLWCHQRPTDKGNWGTAHLHFHVAPVWREKVVMRCVAAGELGSGVMFNPVDPVDAALRLRSVMDRP
jgi:UDPglucose--hexose-1-phosphate uridylyltransferase